MRELKTCRKTPSHPLSRELSQRESLKTRATLGVWALSEARVAATALDLPLEQIFQANIDKLKKRYPNGFEVKRSLARLKGDL